MITLRLYRNGLKERGEMQKFEKFEKFEKISLCQQYVLLSLHLICNRFLIIKLLPTLAVDIILKV